MRYELSDYEWTAIKPMLPNKPGGVRRLNDRRVLNGISWVLRSGAPWRDLPEDYGPYTTCYNRFVRWRKAEIWDRIMDALAAGHDAGVQMIDTSGRARAPARSLHRGQQSPRYGSFTRRPDEQDSRGGGGQSPASPSRAHARRSARQSAAFGSAQRVASANGTYERGASRGPQKT
jgi:transposase